jgi:hypothetical protein
MNNGARWEVRWVKDKRIARKGFGTDFGAALERYETLKRRGMKLVVLRCTNVGFPPPSRLTAHEIESWKIVRRNGKRYKKKVVTVVNLLEELNAEGKFWCPYCIKVLPFRLTRFGKRVAMVCPVCDVDTGNFWTKYHNPKAKELEMKRVRR